MSDNLFPDGAWIGFYTYRGSAVRREMRMSSEGRRTSTYYVTMGGRVDALVQVDSASRLITIPSTRQAVPTTQVVRTRVAWVYR